MRDRPRLPSPADDDSERRPTRVSEPETTQQSPAEKRHLADTDKGKDSPDQTSSPPVRPDVDPDRRRSAPPVIDSAGSPSPVQRRAEARSRHEQAKRDARQMAAEIRAARAPRPADTTAEPPQRPREPQVDPGRRQDSKPPGLDALLEYRDQRLRQERAKRDNGLQELLDYRDERARQEQLRARRAGYDDMRRPGPPEPDEPEPRSVEPQPVPAETMASRRPDEDRSPASTSEVGNRGSDSGDPAASSTDTTVPPKTAHADGDKQPPDASETPTVEVMRSSDVRTLTEEQREDFSTYADELKSTDSRTRDVVCEGPEGEFQLKQCGDTEYRLTADETLPRAVWADGLNLDLGLAQDAKHIAAKGSSFYRPDTMPTDHMRKIAEERNDHMLLKYREVIRDSDNPVQGLEIVTNDERAATYFAGRMTALEIPGRVVVAREDEHD